MIYIYIYTVSSIEKKDIAKTTLIAFSSVIQYPAFWVPVAELFAAMNTIDTTSKKSRGWLAIQLVSTD